MIKATSDLFAPIGGEVNAVNDELDLHQVDAASDSPADVEAARAMDGAANRWFLDPIFRGEYPADMLDRFAPPVCDGDLEAISAPIDFLGVNNYFRYVVRAGMNGDLVAPGDRRLVRLLQLRRLPPNAQGFHLAIAPQRRRKIRHRPVPGALKCRVERAAGPQGAMVEVQPWQNSKGDCQLAQEASVDTLTSRRRSPARREAARVRLRAEAGGPCSG